MLMLSVRPTRGHGDSYRIYDLYHPLPRLSAESFRGPIFHVNHSWMQDKEGFSLGAHNNFLEIFGDYKKHWFLPVFTR